MRTHRGDGEPLDQGRTIAKLTISGAPDLSKHRRRAIAEWLRQHARDLVKDGHKYTVHYTGRYMSAEGE